MHSRPTVPKLPGAAGCWTLRLPCWAVCAAGPYREYWVVCAAGSSVLLGRVRCWAVCAAGPCVGLRLCAEENISLVTLLLIGAHGAREVEYQAFGPGGSGSNPGMAIEYDLFLLFFSESKTQEWRKGGIGRRVDDFAFVVALAKLVKEEGKMICFVKRPHDFDDRANGYSL
ncbi:hypothetical protein PF010_g18546 [Phytophthora fragariae]|uniref:Uncharacterized protein n=1 Tax=Phytophthora fragariae TaxID=53985 RepID=A0A6G0KKQ6_9STRA|nr:hypothetical protein PF010_g18546 [Phytophthora fragariae]